MVREVITGVRKIEVQCNLYNVLRRLLYLTLYLIISESLAGDVSDHSNLQITFNKGLSLLDGVQRQCIRYEICGIDLSSFDLGTS